MKQLALKGLGLAVLPLRLAEEEERAKRLRRISVEGFDGAGFGKHAIYATVLEGREHDLRIKKVLTLLKQAFK